MSTDRERLLVCRTEEEWQWWIEGLMLGEIRPVALTCLFCKAYSTSLISYCESCIGKPAYATDAYIIGACLEKYSKASDRILAGYDRLCRTGII